MNAPGPDWRVILKDLVRYATVGLGAAVTDLSLYALLTHGLGVHPLIANLISRPIGGMVSFTLNKVWTFRARGRAPLPVQLTRFWCVFGASYALSEGLLFLLHSLAHLGPMPAKIAAEALVGVFNFTMQRQWTFR